MLVLDRDLGLAVGAEVGSWPALRTSASRRAIRCASAIGSGISSGVSRQAKPNIIPWSPAPSSRRGRRAVADLERRVDAQGDVRRLVLDRDQRAAGLVVEAVVGLRVADVADGLADDLLEVDVGVGRDLAEDDDEAGRRRRLAGDPRVRILADDRVEDRVRDLVAHLVGMALGHRLRGEQVLGASTMLVIGLLWRSLAQGITEAPRLDSEPMETGTPAGGSEGASAVAVTADADPAALDAADPLAPFRDRFLIPDPSSCTSTGTRSAGRRGRRSSASPASPGRSGPAS